MTKMVEFLLGVVHNKNREKEVRMKAKQFFLFYCILLLVFMPACKDNTDENDTNDLVASPSFATHIQAIFNNSCTGSNCHSASSSRGGLSLAAGQAYANLVNITALAEANKIRVIPNDADNSYLIIRLEGRQTVGGKMPQGGSLSTNRIQNIKNWINQGAQNN
jgi:hypothetical protein